MLTTGKMVLREPIRSGDGRDCRRPPAYRKNDLASPPEGEIRAVPIRREKRSCRRPCKRRVRGKGDREKKTTIVQLRVNAASSMLFRLGFLVKRSRLESR
jgi:hypothetical protein